MILPSGVNKATGLQAALCSLGLSAHNVVGIGDAENDHALLGVCECAVAVGDAIETLKQRADFVTQEADGAGVTEIIEQLLSDDLAQLEDRLVRHHILLGRAGADEIRVPPYGTCILVAGPSGSGKSTIVAGMLERICAYGYQYCVIDPEGDFSEVPDGIVLGDTGHAPGTSEVLQLVDAFNNISINLLGVAQADRPIVFAELLPKLQERRVRTGRPHWLILDEVHHLLPGAWRPAPFTLPQALGAAILVTVHPEQVSPAALALVNILVAVGNSPEKTLHTFAMAARRSVPTVETLQRGQGTVLVWDLQANKVCSVMPEPPQAERRRHRRKYAQGDIHEKSFYFRGPGGKLNLRAQNLTMFAQMAAGVDEETWKHHLHQRDYSRWIREAIKDQDLADTVAAIETQKLSPDESRRSILAAIEEKYTGMG
jgi:energy-coupling factor transporter ATP-binding protein EcfA2